MNVNLPFHYILDGEGNPVPEPDYLAWATWYEESQEQRRTGNTTFKVGDGEIVVSTVFLSLVHLHKQTGEPVLYETMVFAPENILEQLADMSESDISSIVADFVGQRDI